MSYTPTVWSTGDTITATLANHWESQYDAAMSDISSGGNAATATSAGELSDYNGGHTIKATWTGSAIEFEVDSLANGPVEQALNSTNATNSNYATNAGTASNANTLGGQAPNYYAPASSVPSNIATAPSGGTMIQSGFTTLGSSGQPTVTFPVAYASTPNIVCTYTKYTSTSNGNNYAEILSESNTGFTCAAPGFSGTTVGIFWIAIGN